MKIKILVLILALFIAGCSSKEHDHSETAGAKKTYYCPMHPEVTSDKPSVCPICQMDLVLKTDDNATTDLPNTIKLSEGKQVLANVKTLKVAKDKLTKEIKSFGYVDFAEPNKRSITARFNGRIEKLFINKTGDIVAAGAPLFEIYSPDLIQAQNECLIMLKNSTSKEFSQPIAKRLELLGFTKAQIDELAKSGEVKPTFTYHSPFSGTVLEKKIQEGTYVNEGAPLYEIADLTTVWNVSEVFSEDVSFINKGMQVKITSQAFPNQTFTGTVDFIYPVVDQQNKTVKVRVSVNNSSGKLKPNLYTESYFSINLGSSISVPADAIIMTGTKNIVWVKKSMNEFELREIKLGAKSGNKYQVLSGLSEGEEIAASGGYLIDSENQLKGNINAAGHSHADVNADSKEKSGIKAESKTNEDNSIVRKGVIDLKSIDVNKDGKVYQDLMDWNVLSDKPGKCPLCGMVLQEVSLSEAKKNLEKNGFKVK